MGVEGTGCHWAVTLGCASRWVRREWGSVATGQSLMRTGPIQVGLLEPPSGRRTAASTPSVGPRLQPPPSLPWSLNLETLGASSNHFCISVQVPSHSARGWGLSRLQAPQPLRQKPRPQTKGGLPSSPGLVTPAWLRASLRGPTGPPSRRDRGRSKLPGGMGSSRARPEGRTWELDLRSLIPLCRHNKGGQGAEDRPQGGFAPCGGGDAEGFPEGCPSSARVQGGTSIDRCGAGSWQASWGQKFRVGVITGWTSGRGTGVLGAPGAASARSPSICGPAPTQARSPSPPPGPGEGGSRAAHRWPGNAHLAWACRLHLRQHSGLDNTDFAHLGAPSTNLLICKVIQAVPERSPHWAVPGEGKRTPLGGRGPSPFPTGVILEPCLPAGQLGQEMASIQGGGRVPGQGSAHMG